MTGNFLSQTALRSLTVIVVLFITLENIEGARLTARTRFSTLDWVASGFKGGPWFPSEELLSRLQTTAQSAEADIKHILEHPGVTDDCKANIQHCLSQQEGTANCKEDIFDCAKDAIVGPMAEPVYSQLADNIDLKDLLQKVGAEVSLPDASSVARKLMKKCVGSSKGIWRALLDRVKVSVSADDTTTLSPQADFFCGALTGHDEGTYPDVASAPLSCNYALARTVCERRESRPSIGTQFSTWYPKVVGSSVAQKHPSLPACWETGDRGQCVGGLLLASVCYKSCSLATCIYHYLHQTGSTECKTELDAQLDVFLKSANQQCVAIGKVLHIAGSIEDCPKIPGSPTSQSVKKSVLSKRAPTAGNPVSDSKSSSGMSHSLAFPAPLIVLSVLCIHGIWTFMA